MQRLPPLNADTTRERLLLAAFDAFSESGFNGTTTRDICARAQVNSASLNYHWRSKEELWAAVCELAGRRIAQTIGLVDMTRPPAEVLADFLRVLFDNLILDDRPIRVVMWASLQARALDYDATARLFKPLVDLADGYLKRQQTLGRLPADLDVEMVAPLAQSMIVYSFVNRPGLARTFGRDLDDPVLGARVREAIVRSVLLMLGLWTPPAQGT